MFLVRDWVQEAYGRLIDRRGWIFATTQGQLPWADARNAVAVVTTWGSRTVTSAGLFSAADVGRQLRQGTYPVYTIVSVESANSLTLDMAYYGTVQGATTVQILNAYAVLPEDFSRFVVVVSPQNQRLVPWWATQMELDLIDPTRTSTDSYPRMLVANRTSPVPATLGQVMYEYWPYPTAQGALQYYYVQRPSELADSFRFSGVLAHRTDVLVEGALALAAQWPGTATEKNPYFNLQLATQHEGKFIDGCDQLDIRDDDQNPQSFDTIPWQKWNAWAWAYNTHLLQQTDATLADYAGYLGSGWGGGW